MGVEEHFIRDSAWEFILSQNICSLPVDPFSIAEKNEWQIYSFLELSKMSNISIENILKKYGCETFMIWSKKKCGFIIFFNAQMSKEKIRWKITEEISHIALGHLSSSIPIMTRYSEPDIYLYNEQAYDFTRRVLCPSIVLHRCRVLEKQHIQELCGIPEEYAEDVSKNIKRLEVKNKFRSSVAEVKVEKNFEKFINEYTDSTKEYST